jgi:hypothetical protein
MQSDETHFDSCSAVMRPKGNFYLHKYPRQCFPSFVLYRKTVIKQALQRNEQHRVERPEQCHCRCVNVDEQLVEFGWHASLNQPFGSNA